MTNKDYQGEIAEVIHKSGKKRYIHVYKNSSDFPECEMVLMTSAGEGEPTERVPITEEIWRAVGQSLGYRFVIRNRQNKNSESKIPPTEA